MINLVEKNQKPTSKIFIWYQFVKILGNISGLTSNKTDAS